jgi:putative transposase
MRKSRYSDSQILAILKQNEKGVPVPELCREHGVPCFTSGAPSSAAWMRP